MRENRLVGAPEDRIRVGAVGDGARETEEERAGRGRENKGEISQQCLIYSNRKRALRPTACAPTPLFIFMPYIDLRMLMLIDRFSKNFHSTFS